MDRLLGEYRVPKDSAGGRRRLETVLEERRTAEETKAYQPIRRGWFFGEAQLKRELLAQVAEKAGRSYYGEELRESAAARAEGIVREELARLGWTEGMLAQRRKGDPAKVRVAQRLRRETTMTQAWIAERLQMGTATHLAHLLYWDNHARKKKQDTID